MSKKTLKAAQFCTYNETDLSSEDQHLIKMARKACSTSYSPYSNFQVGAAILLENKKILTGSNQENSSYPTGLCAERVVLFYASANYKEHSILKVAVTAKRTDDGQYIPVTPCGSCRQVLVEIEMNQKIPISTIMQISENEWVKSKSAETLLPFCFNKHSL